MAEAVGLVLGVLALAGSLKDCIDLFSYFSAARSFSKDFELLATKLDVEKFCLLQWADRVRLLWANYDSRLDENGTRENVGRILACIKTLLSNTTDLRQKYGVEEASDDQIVSLQGPISSTRMSSFIDDFKKMNIRLGKKRDGLTATSRCRWVIHDREKFEKFIDDLTYFVNALDRIVPDTRNTTSEMSQFDIRSINVHDLRLLRLAVPSNHPALAEAVEHNWNARLEKQVLDAVWFRAMDDRKAGVGPQHVNTFEWAVESQSDLMDWLEYGDGIYWVSGKAASGKSTLMKFLFNDQRTTRRLQRWAGSDSELRMSSFFLWNIGTEEQKSHTGVARAFLYQFLESDRSLIPTLLPSMWREVQKRASDSGPSGPPISPSKAEIRQAVALLKPHLDNRVKYCLFLDGLDELAGDHAEGIALVQSLSAIENIKVIVSSRPIALCQDAFAAGPHLRLQDLTKGDISTYVHDHIKSHHHMINLGEEYPEAVADTIQKIIDRASGVFLWVKLACKSVKEGLAKFDSIQELQDRVNKLPPQLEDLFAHILSRIDPAYQKEAAKILKITHKQGKCGADSLCTLALSIAINIDDCQLKRPELAPLTAAQRNSRCQTIQGRLRSRCWGMLEVEPAEPECLVCYYCEMATEENPSHGKVDFMHRTLFDFLDNPQTWELSCLQLDDNVFDPYVVLARMEFNLCYIHILERSLNLETEAYRINQMCDYVCLVADSPTSFKSIQDLLYLVALNALEHWQLLPQSSQLEDIASLLKAIKGCSGDPSPLIALVFAVEAGMVRFVNTFYTLITWTSHHLAQDRCSYDMQCSRA